MTARRNAKTTTKPEATEAIPELFAADNDGQLVDFGDVDWVACGTLIAVLVRRGALVSFYVASDNDALCISVGVGEQRKRFQAETPEQFDQLVEGLRRKLGVSLAEITQPKKTR
jgi:hypothetical protein